jgi:2-methylcitrate dehydratase PrpD
MEILIKLTEEEQQLLIAVAEDLDEFDSKDPAIPRWIALAEKIRRARDAEQWEAPEYTPSPGDKVTFTKVSQNVYTIVSVESGMVQYRFEDVNDYQDTLENCRRIGMTKIRKEDNDSR